MRKSKLFRRLDRRRDSLRAAEYLVDGISPTSFLAMRGGARAGPNLFKHVMAWLIVRLADLLPRGACAAMIL